MSFGYLVKNFLISYYPLPSFAKILTSQSRRLFNLFHAYSDESIKLNIKYKLVVNRCSFQYIKLPRKYSLSSFKIASLVIVTFVVVVVVVVLVVIVVLIIFIVCI